MKALLFSGAAICVIYSLLVSPAQAQPGSLDATFNPGSGANGPVTCMALQTNGQIVIGGNFTSFNGASQNYVARLNADGSLDTTFYPGVGPNGVVQAVAVQSNGEILIAGEYTAINDLGWNSPALLRTDGSLDTSFNTSAANGSGVYYLNQYYDVNEITLSTGGKVLIGGDFGVFNSGNGFVTNFSGIARLNTNGTLDGTFDPGNSISSVNAVGLQSSGKIIVAQGVNSGGAQGEPVLERLNTDGSVDGSFNPTIQDGSVLCLAVTPQDEIVIGGIFTSINGYSRQYVARLNSDGSLDTRFNPGLGFNSPVTGMALQPNGEVIVSGAFTTFNGVSIAGGLAVLNTNGTLDTTFNPGTGPNVTGVIVASQPDGRTLIAGNFTKFNGTNINRIARLNASGSATLNLLSPQLYFGMSLTGVVSNTYQIQWATNMNTPSLWTPLFDITLQTSPQFILDSNGATGQRFYRAVQVPP